MNLPAPWPKAMHTLPALARFFSAAFRLAQSLCTRAAPALLLSGFCASCTYYVPTPMPFEAALDGPPLAIYGRAEQRFFEGEMERGAMVGHGNVEICDLEDGLTCSGKLDMPPSDKNRVYAILNCSDESNLLLIMRNLGPDQGFALGGIYLPPDENNKEGLDRETGLFFYHSSAEEARRRLPALEHDMKELVDKFPEIRKRVF